MSQEIKIQDSRICLSIESIIQAMSFEQKREVLAWLATDDDVVRSVVDHICGQDEHGWSSGDPNRRVEILARIENSQLSGKVRYNWRPWDEAKQKIKNIRSTEHLYWLIYHKFDKNLSIPIMDELRRLGVESNYTTKEGDEDIARIEQALNEAFQAMNKTTETKPSTP